MIVNQTLMCWRRTKIPTRRTFANSEMIIKTCDRSLHSYKRFDRCCTFVGDCVG